MIQKLFPLDKNFILKEAQVACKESLLLALVEEVKQQYFQNCNPLGLEDDPILTIKNCKEYKTDLLVEFYDHLAGIYRYKYGSNQLELLFDGRDHFEKYQEDWTSTFMEWIMNFCKEDNFLKAVLEVTIFYPSDRKALLAGNRLKTFISHQFEMKVYKFRGIIPLKKA